MRCLSTRRPTQEQSTAELSSILGFHIPASLAVLECQVQQETPAQKLQWNVIEENTPCPLLVSSYFCMSICTQTRNYTQTTYKTNKQTKTQKNQEDYFMTHKSCVKLKFRCSQVYWNTATVLIHLYIICAWFQAGLSGRVE